MCSERIQLPLHRERTYGKNRRTTVKNLFDHRQDAGEDRLGQLGPCIHHGGQIGVMVTTN